MSAIDVGRNTRFESTWIVGSVDPVAPFLSLKAV